MNTTMSMVIAHLIKLFATYLTFEVLFSRVDSIVNFQMGFSYEFLHAVITVELFVVCVRL